MAQPGNAVEKALLILDFISLHGPAGKSDISRAVGINRTTAHRLMTTLEAHGYIMRNHDNRYVPGLKALGFYRLAHSHEPTASVRTKLQDAATRVNATVHLALCSPEGVLVVDKFDPPDALVAYNLVGRVVPFHATALGKAYLATVDTPVRERILQNISWDAYTSHTIASAARMLQEISEIQRRGYATEHDELNFGFSCIAVAFAGEQGKRAPVAISISGPTHIHLVNQSDLVSALRALQEEVGGLLGDFPLASGIRDVVPSSE